MAREPPRGLRLWDAERARIPDYARRFRRGAAWRFSCLVRRGLRIEYRAAADLTQMPGRPLNAGGLPADPTFQLVVDSQRECGMAFRTNYSCERVRRDRAK